MAKKKGNTNVEGTWVIRQIKLRDTGGWHNVAGIADIIEFKNDSIFITEEIASRQVKSRRYVVEKNRR